jgi:lysozyme
MKSRTNRPSPPRALAASWTNAVVDLSHHNGTVDLGAAKVDGIVGVIHKSTQGLDYADPLYAANRTQAGAQVLRWGAYHFGTGDDPIAQAEHFLAVAEPGPRDLLVLDLESNLDGPSMSLEEAREFVSHVQLATGRWPGLYSGNYVKEMLGGQVDPVLANCWFWLAQYGPTAVVPPTWQAWTLWQYTDGGQGPPPHDVAGIGRCDRDLFAGTLRQLLEWWDGAPAEASRAA